MVSKRLHSPSPVVRRITRSQTKAIAESLAATAPAIIRKLLPTSKKTKPSNKKKRLPKKSLNSVRKVKPAVKSTLVARPNLDSENGEDPQNDKNGLVCDSMRVSSEDKSSPLNDYSKGEEYGSAISPISASETSKQAATARDSHKHEVNSPKRRSSTEKNPNTQSEKRNLSNIRNETNVPVTRIVTKLDLRVPRVQKPPQARRRAKPSINSWGETLSEEEQNEKGEVDDQVGDLPDSAGSQYTLKPLRYTRQTERAQGARHSGDAGRTIELHGNTSSALESPWLRELRIGRSEYSGIFRRPSTVYPTASGPSSARHDGVDESWKSPRYIDSPKNANSLKIANSIISTKELWQLKTSSPTQVEPLFEQFCKDANLASANLQWTTWDSDATVQTLDWYGPINEAIVDASREKILHPTLKQLQEAELEGREVWNKRKNWNKKDNERTSDVPSGLRASSTLPQRHSNKPPASCKSYSSPNESEHQVRPLNSTQTSTFPDYPPILPPGPSPWTPEPPLAQPPSQLHLDHRRNLPLHKLLHPKPADWIPDHPIITPAPGTCTCSVQNAHIFTVWNKLPPSSSSPSPISPPRTGSILELRGQCETCKKLIPKDDPRGVGEAFSPSSETWQRLFYGAPWNEVPCEQRGLGVSKEWKGRHVVFHDEEGGRVEDLAEKGKGKSQGKNTVKGKGKALKNEPGDNKKKSGVKTATKSKGKGKPKKKSSVGKKPKP